ncbi:MAG: hypothetical protein ABSB35_11560 [Bryobacteraceae bacterium]|jgi:Arc/MetJ-type ribon-helix-helix transcriptional regulator
MAIQLKPEQERRIEEAIQAGLIRSLHDFIETAIKTLPLPEVQFDKEKAHRAGARIREIRKGVRLDLQGMSIREFAHIRHKY